MYRLKLIVIAICIIPVILLSSPAKSTDIRNTDNSVIHGHVMDIQTNKPLAGACISLTDSPKKYFSGAGGDFVLNLEAKPQNIRVSLKGYQTAQISLSHIVNPLKFNVFLEPSHLRLKEEIWVKGELIDESVEDVVLSEEVIKLKTSRTADALVTDLAGVDVRRTSPGGDKGGGVFIRGFDESRSLILLNGRPLNGSGVMGGDYVDWSSLSSEDIERIEVIRGAKSAEYGNTMGGVINIVTKTGAIKPKTMLRLSYGAFDTKEAMISHQGSTGKFLSYHLSTGYWLTDGYLRNNDVNRKNFSGMLSFKLPAGILLQFNGRYTIHERGFIVENMKNSKNYDPEYPESLSSAGGGPGVQFKGGDYTWGDGSFWKNIRQQYDLHISKSFDNLKLEGVLYVNDQDRTEYFYAQTDPQKLILQRFAKPEDFTWGWNIRAAHHISNHQLKYGLEGSHLRYGGGEIQEIDPDYFKFEPEMELETIEAIQRHSAFIEDNWNPSQRISFNLGVRYDLYKGVQRIDDAIPQTTRKGISPKLGVMVNIWQDTTLDVSVGRAMRFPTCPEFYWYYGGYQPSQRKSLSPEDALQFEAAIKQKIKERGQLTFRIYYYHVNDYIRTIFGYRPSRVVYNVNEATFLGTEFEMQWRIFSNFMFFMNYTYQLAKKKGDTLDFSSDLTDRLTELPAHKFNTRFSYQGNGGIKGDLSFRYVGKRSTLTGNLSKAGGAQLIDMRSYLTADFNFSIPVTRNQRFNSCFKMALENIFNAKYEEVYGFPMPGIRLLSGIDITF